MKRINNNQIFLLSIFVFTLSLFFKEGKDQKAEKRGSFKPLFAEPYKKLDIVKRAKIRAALWRTNFKFSNPKKNKFFNDTTKIDVLATAIVEEWKFGIPAEIKLAQAILETGWGEYPIGNNWFGIKDKTGQEKITTEYVSKEQLEYLKRANKVVKIENHTTAGFKIKIKDTFLRSNTVWENWRAHSNHILNARHWETGEFLYRDLLNCPAELWFEGLKPYATSPIYIESLKRIIKENHLDKI